MGCVESVDPRPSVGYLGVVFVQDYPKSLGAEAKVGFTSVAPWLCFSPCKNNTADAAKGQVRNAGRWTSFSSSIFSIFEIKTDNVKNENQHQILTARKVFTAKNFLGRGIIEIFLVEANLWLL